VLPTVDDPAVLDLEDDAAADFQAVAVPLLGVAMIRGASLRE
jgi:hypothetical protein